MKRFIATVGERKILASTLLTTGTLILVLGVTLTTTSLGCRVSLKSSLRCAAPVGASLSPVPYATPTITFAPMPTPNPNPSVASNAYPPYDPGASGYPYNPPASGGGNPYSPPDSGAVPPFNGSSSGNSGPALALSCRLPVYAGGPGTGGFVIFPGGNFVADPKSSVTAPSPSPGSPSPPPQGPGYGYPNGWWGTTYDRAYSRWLPVPRAWVSPDGTRYAYPGVDGIYVQNIVNGTNVELGSGHAWSVLDVEAEGVYVNSPPNAGLWLLPFSGSVTQITSMGFWQGVAAGAAYGTETAGVPQGATDTIIKLDLRNRTTTPFFSRTGAQSRVLGFDPQGHPIVTVFGPGANETWIVTAANYGTPIAVSYYGQYQNGFAPSGNVVGDSHGLWFSGNGGIALYVPGSGWFWMASLGAQIAGACV